MANTTASASGTKRYFAVPERKKIGTKTMQIQSVETKAGTAIWAAPLRMHLCIVPPSAIFRWIFSISTVASSTRIPTAKGHDIDRLSESAQHDNRTKDGERD